MTSEEMALVGEIDRTEHIDLLYVQRGTDLVERPGEWSAPPWETTGDGEHSVAAKTAELEAYLDAGGIALGAFVGGRLVGLGVVVPHVRPTIAQLAFLHVTHASRGAGIGRRLTEEMAQIARDAGATAMVVSASPTGNTVRFYLRRGFAPMAEPLPELLEHEPEDVHMGMAL